MQSFTTGEIKALEPLVENAFVFWRVCPGFHNLFKAGEVLQVSSSFAKGWLEEAVKKSLLCIFSGMVRNPSEDTENIFGTEVMNHNVKVQQQ